MCADQRFEERVAGQAIGAVQSGAGDLAHGVEAGDVGLSIDVCAHATALIMRRGHHWDRLFGNVDAVLEAGSIDIRKALNQEWRRFVRDIEQDVISAAAFHFVINGARHHIARGQ